MLTKFKSKTHFHADSMQLQDQNVSHWSKANTYTMCLVLIL